MEGNSFAFLNAPFTFGDRIDWHLQTGSKLWRYNLHYFDYALDLSCDPRWIMATMTSWIADNPPRRSTGWEPYPASLQIVNWIKFALTRGRHGDFAPAWHKSLFQQIGWLERNLEHEIQANHLLKNAKALLFGGAYFEGPDADRWLRQGTALFLREVHEQILSDGGHYERSAMYHAIVLEDILDAVNLAASSRELLPSDVASEIADRAALALDYLNDITPSSGELPMFNDSAGGVAKDTFALSDYAARVLGISGRAARITHIIDKPDTGYFGYRHGEELLLIDAGPIGPAHQPGHGHCDLLSFELTAEGLPFVVNSGTYDYENSEFRQVLRSTAAHNTVRIDGLEQSDIWGCFRVGRRAKPIVTRVEWRLPHRFCATFAHDGYSHLPGQPIHQRTFDCEPGRRWEVRDTVLGKDQQHRLESFIHFHPDFRLDRTPAGDWTAMSNDGLRRYRIRLSGADAHLERSTYCPAFGVRRDNWTLRLATAALLPATIGYVIEVI